MSSSVSMQVNPYNIPAGPSAVCSYQGLLYFVAERELIRLRRLCGDPAPWTDDPILRRYKFTNVRRRDDRVSQWVLEHLIRPFEGAHDLWFTLLITRLINWPPTLKALLATEVLPATPEEFDADRFVRVVDGLKLHGKVYGGAYMVYPTKKDPGGTKARALATHIIGDAVRRADVIRRAIWGCEPPSVERTVEALSGCFGISTFMAGQVAADLSYSPVQLGGAVDLYSYAPIGPGSSRGLNYLLHRAPHAGWGQAAFNRELVVIREMIVSEFGFDDMTLHDVQNCMCEYSKYARTALGEGVPKTTYKAEMEF